MIYSSSQQQSLGSAPSQDELNSKDKSKSTNNKEDFEDLVYCDLTTTTYDMEQTDNIYEALDVEQTDNIYD